MYLQCADDSFMPGLFGIDVVTKEGGKQPTYCVELAVDAAQPPQALLDDFAAAGFRHDDPATPFNHSASPYPLGDRQVQELVLSKQGTGIFGLWESAEYRANMAALRQVFAKHQLAMHTRRKSMAEML